MAHVLILEEDAALGDLIRLYLQDEGHTATVTSTVDDALRILSVEAVHLVLRDSLVPTPARFWAMRDPLLDLNPRPPIIVVTGHRLDPARLQELGYAGFLQKPFDIDDLDRMVQQVLRHGETWSV